MKTQPADCDVQTVVDVRVVPHVVVVVVVEYGQTLQKLQNHCLHAFDQPPSKVLHMAYMQSPARSVVISKAVFVVSGAVVVGPKVVSRAVPVVASCVVVAVILAISVLGVVLVVVLVVMLVVVLVVV